MLEFPMWGHVQALWLCLSWITGKPRELSNLNLGVRVEVNGQPSEVEGRISNFFPQFYAPPPTRGFTDPISSGFVLPDNYHGYAPAGFPRTNSTLLNHPIQVHPEP